MSGGGFPIPGFTPLKVLGSGASGQVVLARHDDSGTPVAVKFLSPELAADPSFREQFVAEARVLMDVDNPHVARLYEYVDTTSGPVIVMEAVNGVSLRELVGPEKQMPPEAALVVMKGSLLGLAAAHERGVVHRDYKPQNVLVREDGISKLLDFGIAVPAGAAAEVAGTPSYMAPEQWAGAPASPATDVYAVTATFFFCLTGSVPFPAQNLWELRLAHESGPVPVSSAPEPVQGLVAAGLAKDPAARPASAREFVDQLEAAAVAGYGADWEARGLKQLSGMVALAAMLLPFGPSLAPATFTSAVTVLKGSSVPARVIGGSLAALLVSLLAVQAAEPGKKAPDNFVFAAQSTTTLGATSSSSSTPPSLSASPSATPSSSTPASSSASTSTSASPTPTTTATTVVPTLPNPTVVVPTLTKLPTITSLAPKPTSASPTPPNKVGSISAATLSLLSGITDISPTLRLVFDATTTDPRPIDLVINWGTVSGASNFAGTSSAVVETRVTLSGKTTYTGVVADYTFPDGQYCGMSFTATVQASGISRSAAPIVQCARVTAFPNLLLSHGANSSWNQPQLNGRFYVTADSAAPVHLTVTWRYRSPNSRIAVTAGTTTFTAKGCNVSTACGRIPSSFTYPFQSNTYCGHTLSVVIRQTGYTSPVRVASLDPLVCVG